jgi:hypothetical protein
MSTASTTRPSLKSFTSVQNASRARPAEAATKAVPASVSDPLGVRRLACSKAATAAGYQRVANDISRQLVGIPFTRTEQDEIRAQRNGLAPQEIDRNAYRQSTKCSYAPRDTRKRRPA